MSRADKRHSVGKPFENPCLTKTELSYLDGEVLRKKIFERIGTSATTVGTAINKALNTPVVPNAHTTTVVTVPPTTRYVSPPKPEAIIDKKTLTPEMKKTINGLRRVCNLSQPGLKTYLSDKLEKLNYNVLSGNGFLYAEGTFPVLLVAHLDTVHAHLPTEYYILGTKLSCKEGIGGDDRCGVYIILKLLKEFNCSVLFCEDEEVGCVGASKFVEKKIIPPVNYLMEFDRKGNTDAVFYDCDNPEFTKFITEDKLFKMAYGSYSDISKLAIGLNLAAVNLSSAYYSPHMVTETIDIVEIEDVIKRAVEILKKPCEKPFVFIRKKYSYAAADYLNTGSVGRGAYNYYGRYDNDVYYEDNYYGANWRNRKAPVNTPSVADKGNYVAKSDYPKQAVGSDKVTVEIYFWDNVKCLDQYEYEEGSTEAECVANFLAKHPSSVYADILDIDVYN